MEGPVQVRTRSAVQGVSANSAGTDGLDPRSAVTRCTRRHTLPPWRLSRRMPPMRWAAGRQRKHERRVSGPGHQPQGSGSTAATTAATAPPSHCSSSEIPTFSMDPPAYNSCLNIGLVARPTDDCSCSDGILIDLSLWGDMCCLGGSTQRKSMTLVPAPPNPFAGPHAAPPPVLPACQISSLQLNRLLQACGGFSSGP